METELGGALRALAPAARPGGRPHPRHADRRPRGTGGVLRPASGSCSPTSRSQAGVSIENVDLHETVQRQAVTDELTGLFNHRRFQEVIFQRGRARQALRRRRGPDHARHRQLQARQRHLRPPAGRPRAARGGAGAARVLARDRRARPLRRRGDGGRAARHRPRRRLQVRRARAPRDRVARAAADRRRRDAAGDRLVRRRRAGRRQRRGGQGRARGRGRRRALPRQALREEPHRSERSRL